MSESKVAPNHRPLERFITLMVVGLTLFCVATAGLGALSMERQRVARATESARDEVEAAQTLELAVLMKQIQLEVVQVQQFLTDVSATRGLAGLDDGWSLAEQNAQAFKADVARARRLAGDLKADGLAAAFDNVEAAFPAYYAAGQTMAHAYVDGGTEPGNAYMATFDSSSTALAAQMDGARAAVDALQAQKAKDNLATETRLRADQTLAIMLCGAMALAAIGIGVFVVVLTRKRLLRPLAILSDYMGRLAEGDYEHEPPFRKRTDELGGMARSIGVFRAAAIERRQARDAQEADRDALDVERRQAEQERATIEAERTGVVGRLAEALGRLSDGDLTTQIETPFPPAFEVLRSDFNSAVVRLSTALGAIAAGAASMQNGSEEIASAADDLSRRTEQQAASLEQTAAALDQIAETVNRATAGAKEAASVVAHAKSDAERSGDVVNRAVAAMSEIESSSTQISRIIGVIDEIAFQTNLLALNAGVEAARAGESGRGFAVVAQEVRALAQRSADAAKEIKGLITQSGAQVAAGVDLVGQTGKTLHRIVEEVIRVDALVNDIARSAEEQSVGLRQVNTAVNHMDQVTQQNAAMVEQTTAATHSLRAEAMDLSRQVAEFKLGRARPNSRRTAA